MYKQNHNPGSIWSLRNAALLALISSPSVWAESYIVPPMVNVPAGSFMMGTNSGDTAAMPMHKVDIEAFQMAKYPVTVAEFRKFVLDTGYAPEPTCKDHIDSNWLSRPTDIGTANWDKHRYYHSEYQPVTCVTWQDANAYANWISEKTNTTFRLPTEQEFEYATKANTTSRYFWGDDPAQTQACKYGNFADQSGEYFASKQYGASYVGFLNYANCDDGEPYNSIVGLYRPNPFGLHDMVGNVSQYLGTCYFADGYKERSEAETNPSQCEFIGHRGETWHYPPQPHVDRGRYKREGWKAGALMGFRLAADGTNEQAHNTTIQFTAKLKKAQEHRVNTRPKLPVSPMTPLIQKNGDIYRISWQPVNDTRIVGYDIYRAKKQYAANAHFFGSFYKKYYEKVASVDANDTTYDVTIPSSGNSYRIVTRTKDLTSLPSEPVFITKTKTIDLPGKVSMNDAYTMSNIFLKYSTRKDSPEPFYISKLNKSLEQPLSTVNFKVKVNKSAWYIFNYRGSSRKNGEFFKLWQNNELLGKVNFDKEIDDKTSTRHKVYLSKGEHDLQLTVMREGFELWNITWLKFTESS